MLHQSWAVLKFATDTPLQQNKVLKCIIISRASSRKSMARSAWEHGKVTQLDTGNDNFWKGFQTRRHVVAVAVAVAVVAVLLLLLLLLLLLSVVVVAAVVVPAAVCVDHFLKMG